MKIKIIVLSVVLALMAFIVGIAQASFIEEELSSVFNTNTGQFDTSARNLEDKKWYKIRYYPPNSLNCNKYNIPYMTACNIELNKNPSGSHFDSFFETPPLYHKESFKPKIIGWWIIALYDERTNLVSSSKVHNPGEVQIPEFLPVAFPIAAALGLLFYFNVRKQR